MISKQLFTGINRKKALCILLTLFVLSILLRLPNLNRPVSKHHEFNTAVVLINIASWRQAGGGGVFHYTPLMNFQNAGDKHFDKGPHIDGKGNHLYLSYGPGWYIIPYIIYQLFNLPVDPIYLQILNLFFNLAMVVMLFFLFEKLVPVENDNRYLIVSAGCCLYMFSPGILWYFGNGYINIDIMMPFIVGALLLLLPMLQSPGNIRAGRLVLLSILIIVLIYLDWFIFFICVIAGIIALFKIKQSKKYIVLLSVLSLAAVTGIAFVFFQFASYAGWHTVANYWQLRFFDRSINKGESSFFKMPVLIVMHLFTAYFPLLLLSAVGFIMLKLKKTALHFSAQEIFFMRFYIACVLLYNLVLLNWSSEHEFSMIPFGILPAYVAARLISKLNPRPIIYLLSLFFILSITQYYYINRPGDISRDGMRYDSFKNLGQILQQVPKDYKIFMNIETDPMIEYYAGRNLTRATGFEDAKKYMSVWGVSKGVWVEQDNHRFKSMVVIR